jgi:hypothetical protein
MSPHSWTNPKIRSNGILWRSRGMFIETCLFYVGVTKQSLIYWLIGLVIEIVLVIFISFSIRSERWLRKRNGHPITGCYVRRKKRGQHNTGYHTPASPDPPPSTPRDNPFGNGSFLARHQTDCHADAPLVWGLVQDR